MQTPRVIHTHTHTRLQQISEWECLLGFRRLSSRSRCLFVCAPLSLSFSFSLSLSLSTRAPPSPPPLSLSRRARSLSRARARRARSLSRSLDCSLLRSPFLSSFPHSFARPSMNLSITCISRYLKVSQGVSVCLRETANLWVS